MLLIEDIKKLIIKKLEFIEIKGEGGIIFYGYPEDIPSCLNKRKISIIGSSKDYHKNNICGTKLIIYIN